MKFHSFAFVPVFAAISIVAPQEKSTVATLRPTQREFVALNPAERLRLLQDEGYRKKMREAGTGPVPIEIRWQYEPTLKGEAKLPKTRFRIVLRPQSEPYAAEWYFVSATNAFTVDNLRIAETYALEISVLGERSKTVEEARSTFRTDETAPRLISMKGVRNVRDFGGWKAQDGRRVRQGLVYRSHGLNDNADWCVRDPVTTKKTPKPKDEWKPGKMRGTPLSRADVRSRLGIRTDLDLRRTETECWSMTGSPLGSSVRWVNIPSSSYADLGSERGRAAFTKDFRLFLEPTNYPVCFHCIGGADRTGSLAYVLNGLLGVPEADLDLDYLMTCFAMPVSWPKAEWLPKLKSVFAPYPGATENARIENFVRSCGFTDADLARFRSIMFGETPILPKLTVENVRAVFNGASAMQRRQMMQDEATRKLMHQVAAKANCRDLGGGTGLNGRRLRTNRIFRCAQLESRPKDELKQLFGSVRPKLELDLRTPDNKGVLSLKGVSPIGARYVNSSATCYAGYVGKKGRQWFKENFPLFLDEANYPIVFHCAAGADRTGTLAFVLEGLLGVDEDALLRDWQETAFWNENFLFQTVRYDELLKAMSTFAGDTWTEKIVAYARACGISDAEIERFRALMLE